MDGWLDCDWLVQWLDGQMSRQMDRRIVERSTDGWMDGLCYFLFRKCFISQNKAFFSTNLAAMVQVVERVVH